MRRNKNLERRIADERIMLLMKMAEKVAVSNPDRARRYVTLARRIAMKYRRKMPEEYRRRFCRKCFSFFTTANCRIRIRKGIISILCLNCGWKRRIPYRK